MTFPRSVTVPDPALTRQECAPYGRVNLNVRG